MVSRSDVGSGVTVARKAGLAAAGAARDRHRERQDG